jgi:hypothetical protein
MLGVRIETGATGDGVPAIYREARGGEREKIVGDRF